MKYFHINTREFIRTRNKGYYFVALSSVEKYLIDDEYEIDYRLDLLLHIDDLCKQIMIKPTTELVRDWNNCMCTVMVGKA